MRCAQPRFLSKINRASASPKPISPVGRPKGGLSTKLPAGPKQPPQSPATGMVVEPNSKKRSVDDCYHSHVLTPRFNLITQSIRLHRSWGSWGVQWTCKHGKMRSAEEGSYWTGRGLKQQKAVSHGRLKFGNLSVSMYSPPGFNVIYSVRPPRRNQPLVPGSLSVNLKRRSCLIVSNNLPWLLLNGSRTRVAKERTLWNVTGCVYVLTPQYSSKQGVVLHRACCSCRAF